MIFAEVLAGAFIIDVEPHEDTRGSFSRVFCRDTFAARGLNPNVAQCNLAQSVQPGTLRGLHYQCAPASEAKLVRCIQGAVFDVIIDMRPLSPHYLQHASVTLSAENRRALYVPEGFAHGYQTLTYGAHMFYQTSAPYSPQYEHGVRYDDPAVGVTWPLPAVAVSDKDRCWPLLPRHT